MRGFPDTIAVGKSSRRLRALYRGILSPVLDFGLVAGRLIALVDILVFSLVT